jgi:multiple antibiotic resistance protein
VILGILVTVVVVAVGLMLAARIARLLHPALIQLLTRVLGLLLAAIAVQFVVDAVRIIIAVR